MLFWLHAWFLISHVSRLFLNLESRVLAGTFCGIPSSYVLLSLSFSTHTTSSPHRNILLCDATPPLLSRVKSRHRQNLDSLLPRCRTSKHEPLALVRFSLNPPRLVDRASNYMHRITSQWEKGIHDSPTNGGRWGVGEDESPFRSRSPVYVNR
nr:hypothetical protein CFP56_23990 [Quercus suber]